MSQRKIFLDLDRTLFRTTEFDDCRWALLERWYGVDATVERPRQMEFFYNSNKLYAYDFSSHMKALGINVTEVYQQIAESELADGRLEYDGVGELLEALAVDEVAVLTFGPDDYQNLKASLCPSLAGVRVITTLRAKAEFLADVGGDVWLVDDKPIGDELPAHVQFIQAVGYNGIAQPVGSDWMTASSLGSVRDLVKK